MSKLKLILFDFDGTIANSIPLGFELFQEQSKTLGYQPVHSYQEYQKLLELSLPKLLWKLRIPPWKLQKMIVQNQAALSEKLSQCEVVPGISKVLHDLGSSFPDLPLVVITSNFSLLVSEYLQTHQIDVFDEILGAERSYQKETKIKWCLKHYNVDPNEVVMIGDSVRDIHDAHHTKILSLAVTYGVHDAASLAAASPTWLARSPIEMWRILHPQIL